jgi:L-gulonolactone oxidase
MYAGMEYEPFLRAVQDIALAHDGRPHWGKRHFLTSTDLAPKYERWDAFQDVRRALDPAGKFANPHVRRVLDGTT